MAKVNISPIEQHVIDVVTKLRKERNLRQVDIALIIDTSPSFVGNVENTSNVSKYNLKHINCLADYFQISPKVFFPEQAL